MSVSLNQQIEAVNIELLDLKGERHALARERTYRKQEYDYQIRRLDAALSTLLWVQHHQDLFLTALKAKNYPDGKAVKS